MSPMTIINKGAVATEDMRKEIHPVGARKILEADFKAKDALLSGERAHALMGGGDYKPLERVQDIGMLRANYKNVKRNLERGMPVKLTPAARNYMWKRAKRLKDEIRVGMVRKSELHPVRQRQITKNGQLVTATVADMDKVRATKAIERNRAWGKRNKAKCAELKNILRHLEPNNPRIANIERFRPQ